MPDSDGGLGADPRDVLIAYYGTANAGDWRTWLDAVPGGRGDRRAARRPRRGPRHPARDDRRDGEGLLEVPERARSTSSSQGDKAAVVSHISAANAAGEPIEAEVTNYFQFRDGKIAYMANFHDTRAVPSPSSTRSWTDATMADVRLHRRRRRLGGLVRREPADRGLRRAGAAARGGRRAVSRERRRTPSLWYTLFGTPIDWGYLSVPQTGLDGRQTYEPRGKMPGGSSNLYIMMHIRGPPPRTTTTGPTTAARAGRYDGVPAVLPEAGGPGGRHEPDGRQGRAVHVTNAGQHDPNPTSQAFIDACVELGFPPTDDFNGPNMEGAGWHHINVKDGKRYSHRRRATSSRRSTAPNLTLRDRALAGDAAASSRTAGASGVEYRQGRPSTHDGARDAAR